MGTGALAEAGALKKISENILRLAVQAAPSGLLVVNGGGRIVFANETLCGMFGYQVSELLGQVIEILIPADEAKAHRQAREAYADRPSFRKMGKGRYFDAIRKDGQTFPVEIGLRPEPTETGPVVVATVIDITERKSIEDRLRCHEEDLEALVAERTRELRTTRIEKERIVDQLIQAEKMTAIGTLTTGIGHEINNPLYAILGLAEAIECGHDITASQDQGRAIIKHAKEIAEIVKNLSGYARPAGQHDMQRVDVNERITDAIAMAKRSIVADDIDIRLDITELPDIRAKSEEIQQVLFNIIRNAIQAIEGKGVVEISSSVEQEKVRICIQDSGSGIPPEIQKRIFDPFFTTKAPDEGEGLGLYVVSQIVARYQGTITLQSGNDTGTLFILHFPVAPTP